MSTSTDTIDRRIDQEDGELARPGLASLAVYLLLGIGFGILLIKSEVISWFRIQEMFRFQSFHMYGIIMSAMVVAAVSLAIIRRHRLRSMSGREIDVPPKRLGRGVRYAVGGLFFGFGWALTGACPGPLLALVGSGASVFMAAIASALAGVWVYGHARPHLPH
jgi:uncharacterized protein